MFIHKGLIDTFPFLKELGLYEIMMDTYNTNKLSEEKILEIINLEFDFKPSSMINKMNLRDIEYKPFSNY